MSDLNALIAAHWAAKEALEKAKTEEKAARDALSNFLCKDEESLKNKTMKLSGGWKLKHEVARTLKVNKSHPLYSTLPTILGPEQFNKLVKEKKTLEFSYTAYSSLPPEVVAEIAPFISVNEAVAVKYDAPTDDR